MNVCVEKGCTGPVLHRDRCNSCYRKRLRMGFYGHRDAAQAHAHVVRLRGLGWTYQQIAGAAGVSSSVVYHLGSENARKVRAETEQALLSVAPVPRGSRRGADSAGTRRRVQALVWMGWPRAEVARRAGIKECTLRTVIQPRRRISFASARRVAAVYDKLWMTPGPSKLAEAQARRFGFLSPLAWDDDLIDLPEPELAAEVARRVSAMDEGELQRSHRAHYSLKDQSPVIAAAAREWERVKRDRRKEVAA